MHFSDKIFHKGSSTKLYLIRLVCIQQNVMLLGAHQPNAMRYFTTRVELELTSFERPCLHSYNIMEYLHPLIIAIYVSLNLNCSDF